MPPINISASCQIGRSSIARSARLPGSNEHLLDVIQEPVYLLSVELRGTAMSEVNGSIDE